jgi:hypothetical protein
MWREAIKKSAGSYSPDPGLVAAVARNSLRLRGNASNVQSSSMNRHVRP